MTVYIVKLKAFFVVNTNVKTCLWKFSEEQRSKRC